MILASGVPLQIRAFLPVLSSCQGKNSPSLTELAVSTWTGHTNPRHQCHQTQCHQGMNAPVQPLHHVVSNSWPFVLQNDGSCVSLQRWLYIIHGETMLAVPTPLWDYLLVCLSEIILTGKVMPSSGFYRWSLALPGTAYVCQMAMKTGLSSRKIKRKCRQEVSNICAVRQC